MKLNGNRARILMKPTQAVLAAAVLPTRKHEMRISLPAITKWFSCENPMIGRCSSWGCPAGGTTAPGDGNGIEKGFGAELGGIKGLKPVSGSGGPGT